MNHCDQVELFPDVPGQAICCLGSSRGERPHARLDGPVARPGLKAAGDPEDDDEEEEEKKKQDEDEDEDGDDEEGEEETWQVAGIPGGEDDASD